MRNEPHHQWSRKLFFFAILQEKQKAKCCVNEMQEYIVWTVHISVLLSIYLVFCKCFTLTLLYIPQCACPSADA